MNSAKSPLHALEFRTHLEPGTLKSLGIDSVSSIASMSKAAFVAKFGAELGGEHRTTRIYRYALSILTYLRKRRTRVQGNSAAQTAVVLADGTPVNPDELPPTWKNQFGDGGPYAEEESLGAQDSPGAYAVLLYNIAHELETQAHQPSSTDSDVYHQPVKLDKRRPDIAATALSPTAEFQVIPKITLVNQLLRDGLKSKLVGPPLTSTGGPVTLTYETLMAQIAYPATTLPYYTAYDQVGQACAAKHRSLFQLVQPTDPAFPALNAKWTTSARMYNAEVHGAGLSPSVIAALTSTIVSTNADTVANYVSTYYGASSPAYMAQVAKLSEQLGVTEDDIKKMLCVNGTGTNTSVALSPSCSWPAESTKDQYRRNTLYGARYLCSAGTLCINEYKDQAGKPVTVLAATPYTAVDESSTITSTFYEKFHKLVRLQVASGQPYDLVDSLIVASSYGDSTVNVNEKTFRLLGTYKRWAAHYGATLEDINAFASLLQVASVGDAAAQFDRIYNNTPGVSALSVGAPAFAFASSDDPTVAAICAALKIDFPTFGEIISDIPRVTDKTIACSLENFTALYALTRIPAYLGITPQLFKALMLRTPGGQAMWTALSNNKGVSLLNAAAGAPGLIECLYHVEYLLYLLSRGGIAPATYLAITPLDYSSAPSLPAAGAPTQAHVQLANTTIMQANPARVNVASMLQDLPLKQHDDNTTTPKPIDWTTAVNNSGIVDEYGLIRIESADKRKSYLLNQLTNYTLSDKDADTATLLDAFTVAHEAQWNVADAVLQQSLGLDSMEVTHQILAVWADPVVNEIAPSAPALAAAQADAKPPSTGASYLFLNACFAINKGSPVDTVSQVAATTFTTLLDRFYRLALLVRTYRLGGASVQAADAARNWFGFDLPSGTAVKDKLWMLDPSALVIFSAYAAWRELATNEDAVLQYLADVNATTPISADTAAARLSEQIGATVSDIHAAADWATGGTLAKGIIKTVAQMGRALRLLSTAADACIPVSQLLTVGSLPYAGATLDMTPYAGKTPNYATWAGVAANLLAAVGVDPDNRIEVPTKPDVSMDVIRDTLQQHERDALVATWRMFQAGEITGDSELVASAQDLSDYLLIDTQITSDVDTSVLASAIASLQSYINNILNSSEPGYEKVQWANLDNSSILDDWLEIDGQYDTWAANVELSEYPENYLAPPLRRHPSPAFEKLSSGLQQGQLDEFQLRQALDGYLADFEILGNLTVVSGYFDAIDNEFTGDIPTLTGILHMLGKTSSEPASYYVRSVDVRKTDDEKEAHPLTTAWTPWEEVHPLKDGGDIVGLPRIVLHNSRVTVCWFTREIQPWVEEDDANDQNTKKTGSIIDPTIKLTGYVSYRLLDGNWSAPQEIAGESATTLPTDTLYYYYKKADGVDPVQPKYWTLAFEYSDNAGGKPTLHSAIYSKAAAIDNQSTNVDPTDEWQYALVGTIDSFGKIDKAGENPLRTIPQAYWDDFDGAQLIPDDQKSLLVNKALTRQSRVQAGATGTSALSNGDIVISVENTDPILNAAGIQGALSNELPALAPEINSMPAGAPNILCAHPNGNGHSSHYGTFKYRPGINLYGDIKDTHNPNYYKRGFDFSTPDLIDEGWWFVDVENSDFRKWTGEMYIKLSPHASFRFQRVSSPDQRYLPQLYFPDFNRYQWYTQAFLPVDDDQLELHVSLIYFLYPTSSPNTASALAYPDWNKYLIRFSDNHTTGPDPAVERKVYLDPSTLNCTFAVDSFPAGLAQPKGPYGNYPAGTNNWHYEVTQSAAMGFDSEYTPVISIGTWTKQDNWLGGDGKKVTFPSTNTKKALTDTDSFDFTFDYKASRLGACGLYIGLVETDPSSNAIKGQIWRCAWFRESSYFEINKMHYPVLDNYDDPNYGLAQMLNMLDNTTNVNTHLKFAKIRLNTTFAPDLAAAAIAGPDALYSWKTQLTHEPKLDPNDRDHPEQPTMDYEGSNSLYFWEIFFHVPALYAYLLAAQNRHGESLKWLQRIFDPRARNQKSVVDDKGETIPTPPYWKIEAISPARPASTKATEDQPWHAIDPFALAYADTSHYRKWTYMQYIRTLTAIGDNYYRNLTRDSVNQAHQCYTRALTLMGPRLDYEVSAFPANLTLKDVEEDARAVEAEVKDLIDDALPLQPYSHTKIVRLSEKATAVFLPTINPQLEVLWDTLNARIYNIRHNLDINGTPMHLPLYARPIDPNELLLRGITRGTMGGAAKSTTMPIPPYGYETMRGIAQRAVDLLTSFTGTLLGYRSASDGRKQEQLQMSQLLQLWSFTDTATQQGIDIAKATLKSLKASSRANEQQQDYYKHLIEEGQSALEISAAATSMTGAAFITTATPLMMGAGALDLVPNVYGLAFGGQKVSSPLLRSAEVANQLGGITQASGSLLAVQAGYERRKEEWKQALTNLQLSAKGIDAQIEAQTIQLAAAQTSRAQAQAQHKQNLDMYNFVQHRFTNEELYNALAAQVAALTHQAYDAAMSLCLLAESCWQYELADWDTSFIHGSTWNNSTQGLASGQPLSQALMQMDTLWYSSRNARRLEIVKTVSVKALMGADFATAKMNNGSNGARGTKGQFVFHITQADLDHDYPGHYQRQILSVTVTLPAAIGPMQNVRANLQQTGSAIILNMDKPADSLAAEADKSVASDLIKRDVNVRQMAVLSTGLGDSGVVGGNDGRYLPFEHTGVVSDWILTFPYYSDPSTKTSTQQVDIEQDQVLASLDDIILTITYKARDSGRGADVKAYYH
ncbi:neuraminidase-like domain-containing protein [Bordetella sp. LUAb4]|uniref:Tc toxin subunit A-related protein n=1 Tax=Bordetella sp. LUAb4 TaxID=2843195 RepID=UPI001E3415E7|nr:neuraminidase-like domain-containing protein [Bordetella sp. LUAb4]